MESFGGRHFKMDYAQKEVVIFMQIVENDQNTEIETKYWRNLVL